MSLPLFNIGGLMSGLDTNSIIKGLLDVERIPVTQLQSRRAAIVAKDTAWQDVSTRFSAVRSALNAVDTSAEVDGFVTAASSDEATVAATASGTAQPGSLTFTVDRLASTHRVASTAGYFGATDLVGSGDFTITVGGTGHTVTAEASTTVSGLAQKINALDIGVTASVVSIDGSTSELVFSADSPGSDAAFTTSSTISSLSTTSVVEQGLNALLTVGSGPGALFLERSTNSVTDVLAGVTLDLKQAGPDPVTVTVQQDFEATVTAVDAVMTEINAALTKLGELTAYNADAEKGGVLVGDGTARSMLIDLRSAVSGTVQAGATEFAVPSAIGISLSREGTFTIDTTKLQSALEANHDEATAIIDAVAASLDGYLEEVEGSSGRIARARDAWQSQIDSMDDRIEAMEDRIDRREAQLLRQFTGLETAMASLTAQASWLSSQIGALNAGGGS